MNDSKELQDFPVYEGTIESTYVDGYIPVSYEAPHSSLLKSSTWIGMGMVLASLAGFGILIFAMGAKSVGSQENWDMYAIIGGVVGTIFLLGGFGAIAAGRKDLKAWRARTGRND
ncbi:hypothetical protein CKALI_10630 [Corynebacterium kalinowskii]|uniref:Uncharacterized protein n=1 Tax=Corynebacterium kalinowskii TaxID=2675216 RepID=A0A6B8VTN5_9CORY|nr:hypothetical protein [Corynebacterium kalinowskii]QGU02977.1 hypothetical protein CKALI_10630 [Corynebacterium kalinowskii]